MHPALFETVAGGRGEQDGRDLFEVERVGFFVDRLAFRRVGGCNAAITNSSLTAATLADSISESTWREVLPWLLSACRRKPVVQTSPSGSSPAAMPSLSRSAALNSASHCAAS